jgi:hypothetical protein
LRGFRRDRDAENTCIFAPACGFSPVETDHHHAAQFLTLISGSSCEYAQILKFIFYRSASMGISISVPFSPFSKTTLASTAASSLQSGRIDDTELCSRFKALRYFQRIHCDAQLCRSKLRHCRPYRVRVRMSKYCEVQIV